MAMNFSPSTPMGSIYQHKPKILLSLQPPQGSKNVSCGAASNYVKLEVRLRASAAKPLVVKHLLQKRQVEFFGISSLVSLSSFPKFISFVGWIVFTQLAFFFLFFFKPAYLSTIRVLRCATIEEIEAEKSFIEEDVKERMEKTVDTVRSSFNSIRTGRSNPAMLDKIEVEYYGAPTNLKSIAQISTPDASSLLVKPYDKSALKAIEKAIVNSDLGMTPNNDGDVIRLAIPQLTLERRKELSKIVAKQAEEGKVALRNVRRDAIKSYEKLEKEKKLSEDNVKDLSSDLQKVTDEYMKKIDSLYKQKEKELLTV
ncbi:unnamed protein product [Coffea canephora]|uniref:Ribosome-recycling factor, chloroplastic n=1 Tax=Coffea canephora TaxID=49390 RepID=A0A068U645_COFCA|nr:unnamed protein product [Coffea canephora]